MGGAGPRVGDPAPDFELRDQHGRPVRLSSYRGDRDVVLMFYPAAFSRVCTAEIAALQEALPNLPADRVEVLAVSCDPMFALRAFADADGLTLRLLSDFWPHGAVASRYGAFDEEQGVARRSTYVVDTTGTVRWTVHNALPDPRNVADYVAVLAGLRAP